MPRILPTCKDGFELIRDKNNCKCTRKVIKKPKKTTHKNKTKIRSRSSSSISLTSSVNFSKHIEEMRKEKKKRVAKIKKQISEKASKSVSMSKSRTIDSGTNVLQTHKEYSELEIKSGDWMADPCYILRNLKKRLNVTKWTPRLLKKLDDTIPVLEKISDKVYKYGNSILEIKQKLGSGTYGTVHLATLKDIDTAFIKTIVIKIISATATPLEIFTESILQIELFCDMRGEYGRGARIPKMEFISKHKTLYIIGMEQLDGTFYDFFRRDGIKSREKVHALKGIARFLKTLQRKYKFMHRDFHEQNIMYKKIGTADNAYYRMYVIDFGMSTALINGQQINEIMKGHLYYKKYKFNPSHDMRTLLISMLSSNLCKKQSSYLCTSILLSTSSVLRYKCINESPAFWGAYNKILPILDDTFTPDTMIELFDFLLSLDPAKLEVRTTEATANSIDELLGRICNKKVMKLSLTGADTLMDAHSVKNKCNLFKTLSALLGTINMNRVKDEYKNLQVRVAI